MNVLEENVSLKLYQFIKERKKQNSMSYKPIIARNKSHSAYSYDQDQRQRINNKNLLAFPSIIDKTLLLNRFTSGVIEAASANVNSDTHQSLKRWTKNDFLPKLELIKFKTSTPIEKPSLSQKENTLAPKSPTKLDKIKNLEKFKPKVHKSRNF